MLEQRKLGPVDKPVDQPEHVVSEFVGRVLASVSPEDLLQDWGWHLPGSLLHFELGLGGSHVTSSGLASVKGS